MDAQLRNAESGILVQMKSCHQATGVRSTGLAIHISLLRGYNEVSTSAFSRFPLLLSFRHIPGSSASFCFPIRFARPTNRSVRLRVDAFVRSKDIGADVETMV